ncbi:hypothetical protein CCACVL1_21490 [Corchorus capsularis]|uniref:Uncharacterized protein n=1 Tax=Corchorus capsularis TaxID=210143 RepID=A0A1R3H5G9_COCAP|nr:hypothetical protein CCACVL1_21490 [Corchorus capsularis]
MEFEELPGSLPGMSIHHINDNKVRTRHHHTLTLIRKLTEFQAHEAFIAISGG